MRVVELGTLAAELAMRVVALGTARWAAASMVVADVAERLNK
jgi:hypothetical protein